MLPITPDGPHLSAKQAKTLDDDFFLSDPLAYFTSRIASLVALPTDDESPLSETAEELLTKLGRPKDANIFTFDERGREIQVAIDAVALRHHAAEGLLRFLYALVTAKPKSGDAACVWLAVADSPIRLVDVVTGVSESFASDDNLFAPLYFPANTPVDDSARMAAQTALDWLNHAIQLVTSNELAINAANNKVKHGLAVSARDDVRIELIQAPVEDLTQIPESAFGEGKSIPIFDRPMLTILSRAEGAKHLGLELTSLRVDVPTVLAETWMFSVIYGALFHVAARKHFASDTSAKLAPYPTLPIGPSPNQVLAGQVDGYRGAVTAPADGSATRPNGIFFGRKFLPMSIDFENVTSGVVVEG